MSALPKGCIETMLVVDGTIPLLHYHQDRLRRSIAMLRPEHGVDEEFLSEAIAIYLEPGHNLVIRVEWIADYPEMLLVTTRPVPEPTDTYTVVPLAYEAIIDKHTSWIKSNERSTYDDLQSRATTIGAHDALLVNAQHHIMETCIGNVIFLKDGAYHTPPLSDGCVAGVQRSFLLEKGLNGQGIIEQSLPMDALSSIDALFLCNAVRGIIPIEIMSL